jgi:hypothetical protein
MLEEAGLGRVACEKLGLTKEAPNLTEWKDMVPNAVYLYVVENGLTEKVIKLLKK